MKTFKPNWIPERQPAPRKVDEHQKLSDDFYNSRVWRKLSALKRKANPLCEVCEQAGRSQLATQVHHKIEVKVDSSLRLEWSNLMSVCTSCHNRFRRLEQGQST